MVISTAWIVFDTMKYESLMFSYQSIDSAISSEKCSVCILKGQLKL